MSNFIEEMEKALELFRQIHKREPINSEEFSKWVDYINSDAVTKTTNSRRDIECS